MPWDTNIKIEDDPCLSRYPVNTHNRAQREIHVNLKKNQVRVYVRATQEVHTFGPIIDGKVTREVAEVEGWCHIHTITNKSLTTGKGLLNFVEFCPKRMVGFHSDLWKKDGQNVPIPGSESSGCVRIPHEESSKFYNLVKDGDGVRFYERNFWRPPLFAYGSRHSHCTP